MAFLWRIIILKAMEDQEIINRVRESLALYDRHWEEWLNSEACFLETTEIRALGTLLAFQSIEESARLLAVSRDGYLEVLDHTLTKLKNQHYRYLTWVNSKIAWSN